MPPQERTHIAQIFLWWVSGIGIIVAGMWAAYVYFNPPETLGGSDIHIEEFNEDNGGVTNGKSDCTGDWKYQKTDCRIEK